MQVKFCHANRVTGKGEINWIHGISALAKKGVTDFQEFRTDYYARCHSRTGWKSATPPPTSTLQLVAGAGIFLIGGRKSIFDTLKSNTGKVSYTEFTAPVNTHLGIMTERKTGTWIKNLTVVEICACPMDYFGTGMWGMETIRLDDPSLGLGSGAKVKVSGAQLGDAVANLFGLTF